MKQFSVKIINPDSKKEINFNENFEYKFFKDIPDLFLEDGNSSTKIQVAGMINKHYQDLTDDYLVKTHNQLFPERTTNHKNNIKTKK